MAENRQELEIKFSGTMPVLSALPESAFLRALAPGGGHWAHLESAYFDTEEGALAAAGLSIRQRVTGAGTIQTVKSTAKGSVVARREWEQDLPNAAEFPLPTGESEVDQLLAAAAPRLRQVSKINIDRWSAEFNFQTSIIEIAVDLGRVSSISASGASIEAPLGEVELELITGDPAGLFLAARLMLDSAPLRLHARSKRETARLIAAGRQFAVPDFRPLSASASDSAGDILQRALVTAAERIIGLQASILDARAPEGIHRMRVELRRFRAIERVFRRSADCLLLRQLAKKAGVFARALGAARDWDVFLGETLPIIAENGYAVTGLMRLKAAAQSHRAEAWAATSAQISDPAFSTFALDLLALAHLQPWRAKALSPSAEAFAERALDRTLHKTRKVARGIDPVAPESFHPLRIALKKLRYGVQLFRGIHPKAARKPYMASMAALQDAFGVLNDAVVAQKLADRAAEGAGEEAMRAAGFISGYYAARAEAAAKEIDVAWTMFEKKRSFWRT